MKRATELMCAWSGLVFAVLFAVGFAGVARLVPPMRPSDSATEIAAIYLSHTNEIRTGLLICYIGTMFSLAFGSGIVGQTRRIRGAASAVIYLQIASYGSAVVLVIVPITCWWTAAFRPDTQPAESTQLLNDLGWIIFLIGFVPFVTWFAAIGLAILSDENSEPLYPRWSGYLSIFMAFAQVSAALLIYFKTGPFAWNGLFAWWLPMCDVFTWLAIISVLTIRAVGRNYGDPANAPRGDDESNAASSRRVIVE